MLYVHTHIFRKENYCLRVQFIANMEIESEMRWKSQIQYFACFSKPTFSFSKHEFRFLSLFAVSLRKYYFIYLFI